jgi:uncharacterized protein YchJ
MTGTADCCARLAIGHATAEPTTALMKSRLRTQPSTPAGLSFLKA